MTEALILHDSGRRFEGLVTPQDEQTARETAELLMEHYPGWPWAITAMHDQGVIIVRNLMLHPIWGYTVKIADVDTPGRFRSEILTAGGELLELWNVKRGPMTDESIKDMRPVSEVVADLRKMAEDRWKRKVLAS